MKPNIFKRIWAAITGKQPNTSGFPGGLDCGAPTMEMEPDDKSVQVTLLTALNGQVLRVSTYKRNPHGPDWTHRLYIIERDQSLADAIAVCLVVRSGS